MIVRAVTLKACITRILIHAGATPSNAECVASHLVNANLRGVDTHGVWQLPRYVAAIERGELLPQASPGLLTDSPSFALVTGNWGFGQPAALHATDQALRKAQNCGVAVISIVQSHHIGRLGEYVEIAAREGFISMIWLSGLGEEKPDVMPYGGKKPLFSTNPIAIGLPVGDEPSIVVDFATSAISGVKILEAVRLKRPLPPGTIVDKDGVGTTDAQKVLEGGAQVAFGGHKGYALMFTTEILGRILAGADSFVDPPRGGITFSHHGVTMIALKADLFQPMKVYNARTSELRRRARAIPPAPGFSEVSAPGDPELRTLASRERDGIPIPDDLWQTLMDLEARDGGPIETATNKSAPESVQ